MKTAISNAKNIFLIQIIEIRDKDKRSLSPLDPYLLPPPKTKTGRPGGPHRLKPKAYRRMRSSVEKFFAWLTGASGDCDKI